MGEVTRRCEHEGQVRPRFKSPAIVLVNVFWVLFWLALLSRLLAVCRRSWLRDARGCELKPFLGGGVLLMPWTPSFWSALGVWAGRAHLFFVPAPPGHFSRVQGSPRNP